MAGVEEFEEEAGVEVIESVVEAEFVMDDVRRFTAFDGFLTAFSGMYTVDSP